MNKLLLTIAAGLLLVTGCASQSATTTTLTPPGNAENQYNCSVSQGFDFQKDVQEIVGFINYIKIGDTELVSDLNVTDPTDFAKLIKVTGVLSSALWSGGYAEPLYFSMQVSTDNKNTLADLTHKSMSNTNVVFAFTVYDYDPKNKTYFRCFYTDSVNLQGLILKQGGDLAIAIDMDQSMEVISPKNYTFRIGIMPQNLNQEIHINVSRDQGIVKRWGIAVGQ
jgi:hypothetical protein